MDFLWVVNSKNHQQCHLVVTAQHILDIKILFAARNIYCWCCSSGGEPAQSYNPKTDRIPELCIVMIFD